MRGIVVGLGAMGSIHLRALHGIEGAELVGAVDPSPGRRAAALRQHPGVPVYATLEEAIDRARPDFAAVATPPALLPEVACQALEAGLAVLVEKPMAPTEDEARRIVDLARARGQLLAVGHVERCNPAVIALRERLDAGEAGRVQLMHARRLSPFPDRDSMLGVALDLATHDIDVMRFLAGQEVRRVYAETAQVLHDRAEDLVAATLRFEGGATGLLETNWLTPAKVRQLSVTGEAGMFVVDYLTQELSFFEHPSGDMIRYALRRREPIVVEWEAFLAALRGDGEPMATGEDGLAALSTARAIQRAGAISTACAPGYRAPSRPHVLV